MHRAHTEDAGCVVCHGFIPDLGTEVGSGNRQICEVCHGPSQSGGVQQIHRRHASAGLSCLECHGDERPPVDVVIAPPVGSSEHVCRICHSNYQPSDFLSDPEGRHRRHTTELLDCGSCHMSANLQDDRAPMPSIDDPVRAMVDRVGYGECFHCHEGGAGGSAQSVHMRHLQQWQWCYSCHEPGDDRPQGGSGPATTPAESCILCHTDQTYVDEFPFAEHYRHADCRLPDRLPSCLCAGNVR